MHRHLTGILCRSTGEDVLRRRLSIAILLLVVAGTMAPFRVQAAGAQEPTRRQAKNQAERDPYQDAH